MRTPPIGSLSLAVRLPQGSTSSAPGVTVMRMKRRGVMAPRQAYETRPIMACPQSAARGLMAPGPSEYLNHPEAIRALLWFVAAGLGASQLWLLAAPT